MILHIELYCELYCFFINDTRESIWLRYFCYLCYLVWSWFITSEKYVYMTFISDTITYLERPQTYSEDQRSSLLPLHSWHSLQYALLCNILLISRSDSVAFAGIWRCFYPKWPMVHLTINFACAFHENYNHDFATVNTIVICRLD